MSEWKVPVQSLIDHIKMAVDVDPWAKEMAEELLKEKEPKKPKSSKPICEIIFDVPYYFCGNCKTMLNMYSTKAKFCSQCGQAVQWGLA